MILLCWQVGLFLVLVGGVESTPDVVSATASVDVPLVSLKALLAREHSGRRAEGPSDAEMHEARAMHHAATHSGFFYVQDHGVSASLIDQLVNVSREFFALPDDLKRTIRMELGGPAWRGFFPVGSELTSRRPDMKEGIYFGRELNASQSTPMHGANLFPDDLVPRMRPTVLSYIQHVETVGHAVLRGLALGLGLDGNYFHDEVTRGDPMVLFRIFNYPEHTWDDTEDVWGVREHTDYGFVTILLQDDSGGLEVKTLDGRWVPAPPVRGTLLVNLGDMLQLWTRAILVSTPHRVRNQGRGSRLSFPFFLDPRWSTNVVPLAEDKLPSAALRSARARLQDVLARRWDNMDPEQFAGQTYGQVLWARVSKVFPQLSRSAQSSGSHDEL